MTKDGWRAAVEKAQRDPVMLELLAALLEEQDNAKQALRDKGYGWTGLGWKETVALVPKGEKREA